MALDRCVPADGVGVVDGGELVGTCVDDLELDLEGCVGIGHFFPVCLTDLGQVLGEVVACDDAAYAEEAVIVGDVLPCPCVGGGGACGDPATLVIGVCEPVVDEGVVVGILGGDMDADDVSLARLDGHGGGDVDGTLTEYGCGGEATLLDYRLGVEVIGDEAGVEGAEVGVGGPVAAGVVCDAGDLVAGIDGGHLGGDLEGHGTLVAYGVLDLERAFGFARHGEVHGLGFGTHGGEGDGSLGGEHDSLGGCTGGGGADVDALAQGEGACGGGEGHGRGQESE